VDENDTLVDLIRHGEPLGGRRYRGSGTDDPLSETGWEQMRSALGNQHPWDEVISSPLLRCRDFAEAVAARHGLDLTVHQNLREVGMGGWEGMTPAQVRERDPQAYADFYRDPVGHRPPGAEPLEALISRVGKAYDELIDTRPGKHLLLVVHAGVMRALAGRVLLADLGRSYRLRIDYAGLVRIRHDRFGAVLEWVNAHRLPEDA
jgi:probable phosphoglycerate mutase